MYDANIIYFVHSNVSAYNCLLNNWHVEVFFMKLNSNIGKILIGE